MLLGMPGPELIGNNVHHLKLYLKGSVNVRNITEAYPFVSFFAEVGGYCGLLLGYSLMDLSSILETIFKLFQILKMF